MQGRFLRYFRYTPHAEGNLYQKASSHHCKTKKYQSAGTVTEHRTSGSTGGSFILVSRGLDCVCTTRALANCCLSEFGCTATGITQPLDWMDSICLICDHIGNTYLFSIHWILSPLETRWHIRTNLLDDFEHDAEMEFMCTLISRDTSKNCTTLIYRCPFER